MLIAFISLLGVPLDCRALLLSGHLWSHQWWYRHSARPPGVLFPSRPFRILPSPFPFCCLACPMSPVSWPPFQFPASCLLRSVPIPVCHQPRPTSVSKLSPSTGSFPAGSGVKNPPAIAEDADSIPGSGRSPGGGNGNPL